ncbi:hypothetical protein HPP92_017448 [Vanilla planifolia]|uniref:Sister chromatid cohesion 1 protein 3 n=1 Tax=Vanilla planifolia TaxID=51239 RepID=A0A835QCE2_VANPL|nr:hypothetical protein HPP92_017448 [Vanilla planifolia]
MVTRGRFIATEIDVGTARQINCGGLPPKVPAYLGRKPGQNPTRSQEEPSEEEKIMMPDVPIALRLSGHLLLGLVRIYSWKVNHLFSDCNKLITDIRKAFASVPVDLPIEADHAPFESVTLPETFDLDALELDDIHNNEPDKHLKPYSEITILGQIPMEGEQYVALSVSEDTVVNPSPRPSNRLNLASEPGNLFNPSPQSINGLNLSSQPATVAPTSRQLDEELPPFESVLDSALSPSEPATTSDNLLNNTPLETPSIEKMLDDTDHRSHDVVTPVDVHTDDQLSRTISRGHYLSTIPEDAAITESFFIRKMKRQLDNSSSIVCKRRKLPCSKLDVWKHIKFLRKESLLSGPSLPGMGTILMEGFETTHPFAPSASTLETTPLKGASESSFHEKGTGTITLEAQIETPMLDAYSNDIERARDADNQAARLPSPVETLGLTNLDTPPFHLEEQNLDDNEIPEVPGLFDSSGDLNILDVDSTPQSNGIWMPSQVESWSARTRAVAKYFKDSSLIDQLDSSGRISLNKILEKKTRKQCSRLVFETLVLKSNGFINVEQKEPYGDIFVSSTPALQYAKF